ncbi:MAG: hypothetical protein A2X51_10380 [Candidatus Rokubacteria bacterium GWC2_70_24]|nr:MAG: hypothetical protein A2X51_10380 [Candidatus Rokubacteria bacterium GWC2_70_24]OGK89404.1 MAG: hypothetical protein A2X50_10135 [Candidatus Rokubacteria bacterium GWF2_70_14]OGL19744.1 MAG: hypothetical protein A3K12_07540 [Candidatus Rokubacteria bacterium RIFCSPLOWO2_12_FULL_71_19]
MARRGRLSVFERYLSLWVALCIGAGVLLGTLAPGLVERLSHLEVSHVTLPIALHAIEEFARVGSIPPRKEARTSDAGDHPH